MADSSTTTTLILNLIAGDCWARRRLRNGIRYVPVTSKPMKSLSSVQGVSYQAGDILLDGRLLHNRWTDFAALCGRLLGSMPATRRYKVRLRRINTQEIADSCGVVFIGTLAIPELDG